MNGWRLEVRNDPAQWAERARALRQAITQMASQRERELANPALKIPASKVLRSMDKQWSGLTVFVDHPEVPMDNNVCHAARGMTNLCRLPDYAACGLLTDALAAGRGCRSPKLSA